VRKRDIHWLISLLLVVVLATSCTYFSGQSRDEAQISAKNSDASSAETALDTLKISEPGSMSGYSREKFPTGARPASSAGTLRSRPATHARPR
jgi:hypothetical protein